MSAKGKPAVAAVPMPVDAKEPAEEEGIPKKDDDNTLKEKSANNPNKLIQEGWHRTLTKWTPPVSWNRHIKFPGGIKKRKPN